MDVQNFLPMNHSDFHVLLVLAAGERRGYSIMSAISEITEGSMEMGPGTLYTSIKRLLTAELIEESDARPNPKLDDARRRYYRITKLGRKVLGAWNRNAWQTLSVMRARNAL